jgi:hypothetical protein
LSAQEKDLANNLRRRKAYVRQGAKEPDEADAQEAAPPLEELREARELTLEGLGAPTPATSVRVAMPTTSPTVSMVVPMVAALPPPTLLHAFLSVATQIKE